MLQNSVRSDNIARYFKNNGLTFLKSSKSSMNQRICLKAQNSFETSIARDRNHFQTHRNMPVISWPLSANGKESQSYHLCFWWMNSHVKISTFFSECSFQCVRLRFETAVWHGNRKTKQNPEGQRAVGLTEKLWSWFCFKSLPAPNSWCPRSSFNLAINLLHDLGQLDSFLYPLEFSYFLVLFILFVAWESYSQ